MTESGVDKKLLKQLDKYFHKREHDLKAQILNMHNQKKQHNLLKKCFLSWYNDMKNEKGEKPKINDKEFMDNCNINTIENDLIYEGLNDDDKNKENIKKLSITVLNHIFNNMYNRITKQAFNKWMKLSHRQNKHNKKVLEKTEITMTYETKPMKFQNYCTEYNALLCYDNDDENDNYNNRKIDLLLNEYDMCDLIDYNENENELEYVEYSEIICEDENEYNNDNNSHIIDTVDNVSFNVINTDKEIINNPKFHNEICSKIPPDMKVEEVDISFVTTASLSLITLYPFNCYIYIYIIDS